MTKPIGDRKDWQRVEACADALPRDYRRVYGEMNPCRWRSTLDRDVRAKLADAGLAA